MTDVIFGSEYFLRRWNHGCSHQSGRRYSAYGVSDLDAQDAGGEYLLRERRKTSPSSTTPSTHGTANSERDRALAVGPPITKDFQGLLPGRESLAELRAAITALRSDDNEFDLERLRGLMKVATS